MTLWELTPLVAVVLIVAAMVTAILIELARAWQLHRERTRRPVSHDEWSIYE